MKNTLMSPSCFKSKSCDTYLVVKTGTRSHFFLNDIFHFALNIFPQSPAERRQIHIVAHLLTRAVTSARLAPLFVLIPLKLRPLLHHSSHTVRARACVCVCAYVCHPPPNASSLSSLVIPPLLIHLLALLRVSLCACVCVRARVREEMHCDAVGSKQVFSPVRSSAVGSGRRAAQPGWGISAKCLLKMMQTSEEP